MRRRVEFWVLEGGKRHWFGQVDTGYVGLKAVEVGRLSASVNSVRLVAPTRRPVRGLEARFDLLAVGIGRRSVAGVVKQ